MKVGYIGIICTFCLILAGITEAEPAEDDWTNTRDSFICRSSTEVREIKTYVDIATRGDSPGSLACRVDYIKGGATLTLWSSRTNRSFCNGKASQLAAKLAAGAFTCQPLHLHRSDEN